jgi:hypothetical protein
MTQIHSTAACNAATNAVTALLGSGAKLKFRTSGTIGAPGTAAATLSFSSTPFASAVGGIAEANAITQDSSATGNASPVATATLETSGGTIVVHCTVTADSTGDITLSNSLTIAAGDIVTCTRLRYAALVDKTLSMQVGVNTNYAVYTSGVTPFANVMWNAEYWQDTNDGYNYWTNQDQHNVSGNTAPHFLAAVIAETTEKLPAGTYTVRNPDGCPIAFGDRTGVGGNMNIATSVSSAGVLTTATSFTFTLSASSGLDIWTNGNITNTAGTRLGAIQVILPSHVTSWDAGDYFNSAWVSYQQGLGTQAIRTMDWLGTNTNLFDSWSEMPTLTKTGIKGFGVRYPLDIAIAAANRLRVPLWLNVPVRATDSWVSSAASLIASTYTQPHLYVEYANEVWNTGLPSFSAQTNWARLLPFTKITATCSGTTFTKTAHGLSNSQEIRPFFHKSGLTASGERYGLGTYWLGMGAATYAKVLTANTFEIWSDSALVSERADAGTYATQLLYVDPAEVGKSSDLSANYGARAKQIWDILDAALGSSRVKTVIGVQNGDSSSATARMSVTGVGARTDHITSAPYYYGITMAGAVDRATTQFTPKLWSTAGQPAGDSATVSVAFRVYAAGSTPRNDEVKAGTGTGYVGGSTFTQTYGGASYTSGSAVTGLSDGTSYKCYFCATDQNSNDWIWSQTIAATASADTVDMFDTFANMKLRTMLDIDGAITSGSNTYTSLTNVRVAAQAINSACELVCYEGGNHQSYSRPTNVTTWWETFVKSAEHAEIVRHYLYTASAAGAKLFMWYYDIGASGPWTLSTDNYNTTDLRYAGVAKFGGYVPKYTKVAYSAINGGSITSAPSLPYTVYTFSETNRTYEIVSGDNAANFRVSGPAVQLIASNGINYAVTVVQLIKMRATDGFTDSLFDFSVTTGPAAWYEADANIAWSKFEDTTPAVMNPILSLNTMPENSGSSTPATVDGSDWWCMNGVSQYGNPNAMLTTMDYTKPFGVLWVGKRNGNTSLDNHIYFSSTDYIGFASLSSGTLLKWTWWDGGATEIVDSVDWTDGNPVVAWQYFDGPNNLMYRGKNQTYLTGYSSGVAIPGSKHSSLNKEVQLGITSSKHGAFEAVWRTGMTITDWLAIVQKVQTKFGI